MTTLFTFKANAAEEGHCPCQRHLEKPNTCQGTGALLLSELRIKDGPHLDKVLYGEDINPWATHDLQEFNDHAYEEHRSYAVGYVEMIGSYGPRKMDLEE